MFAGDNRLFVDVASRFMEVFEDGTTKEAAGTTGAGYTPVQFAASGLSVMVATGDSIWRVSGATPGSTDLTVTKTYDGAISVVWLDGYYIILLKDSNTIQLSDLNSDGDPAWHAGDPDYPGGPWNPLDQQTKMGSLDRLVRLEVHEGNLWLFGRETIDVWYNSGDADFPFRRISGAMVDQGTSAPWSVAQIDRKLYWLGRDKRGRGRVFRTEGYTPVPISNPAIEYLIDSYLDLGTDHAITGYGYQEDGQTFYVLSFPTYAQATLVYDLTTNMWHERARWNGTAWEQWRGASFHAHVWGKHIVSRWSPDGPYIGPDHRRLWEMNVQFPDDEGLPIRRQRIAPYVQAEQQFLQHHYLRLYTDSASNVNMRYRNDEGTAWSTPRVVAPFKHEVKYRRLGRARDRLYDIWIDDATKPPMIAEGWLNLSPSLER